MLELCALNSGSNGNCYFIGSPQGAILIDAGLSCRETERRMERLNLSLKNIKAIFISHEHNDHVKGLPQIARKYQIPVYITHETLSNCRFRIDEHLHLSFVEKQEIAIGHFRITPFKKVHDAVHPHSFIVRYGDFTIGIFTDLGKVCSNLSHYFAQCDAAFLEANYCEQLLDQGRYPIFLKNRIRGGKGHLSNNEALDLFLNHRSPKLKYLLLSHLSRDNNSPEKALQLFNDFAGNTEISVASRDMETKLFRLSATPVQIYEQTALF